MDNKVNWIYIAGCFVVGCLFAKMSSEIFIYLTQK